MYGKGLINVQHIPDVHKEWREPRHDWRGTTAWRMFNAVTFALAGRVMDTDAKPRLFNVINSVCEHVE